MRGLVYFCLYLRPFGFFALCLPGDGPFCFLAFLLIIVFIFFLSSCAFLLCCAHIYTLDPSLLLLNAPMLYQQYVSYPHIIHPSCVLPIHISTHLIHLFATIVHVTPILSFSSSVSAHFLVAFLWFGLDLCRFSYLLLPCCSV